MQDRRYMILNDTKDKGDIMILKVIEYSKTDNTECQMIQKIRGYSWPDNTGDQMIQKDRGYQKFKI